MIATHQKGSFSSLAIALMVLSIATVGIVLLSFSDETGSEVSRVSWCFFGSCKTPSKTAVKRWKKEATHRKHKLPCFLGGGCHVPASEQARTWKRQKEMAKSRDRAREDQKKRKWGAQTPKQDKEKVRKRFNSLTTKQRAMLHRQLLLRRIQTRAEIVDRKVQLMALGRNATKALGPGPRKVDRKKTVKKISTQLARFPESRIVIATILDKLSAVETAKVQASKMMKRAKKLTEVANKARSQVLLFAKKAKPFLKKAKADEKAEKLQSRHVHYLAARAAHYTNEYRQLKLHTKKLKFSAKKIELVQPQGHNMKYGHTTDGHSMQGDGTLGK